MSDFFLPMNYTKFTFNPFQENTYVLWDSTKECIIIDPGCYYPAELDTLNGFIKKEGLDVQAIVNTHCHIDHVLGVSAVKEAYGVPFLCHDQEQLNLERLPFQAQMFGLPLKDVTPKVDRFIDTTETVRFGETELEIRFVPGHSPGHLAFYHSKSAIVVGGDVLFRESVGRTDLPGCNEADLYKSIIKELYTLPDETKVLAGHMDETTIGHEKANNQFVLRYLS